MLWGGYCWLFVLPIFSVNILAGSSLQLDLLIALSFVFTITVFLLRGKRYVRLFFLPKFLLLALYSDVALGAAGDVALFLEMEVAIIWISIIEISLYFEIVTSLFLDAIVLVLALGAILATSALDHSFPPLLPEALSLVAASAVAGSLAANSFRSVIARLSRSMAESERLDKAVSLLIDANIDFQRFAATAGEESADRERKRVSRDIHDTAVHSFVNIIMLAESIHDKVGPEKEKILGPLDAIISQAKDAVRDTRHSLRELRDISEERPRGLRAIHRLTKVFSDATGVAVDVHYGNLPWELSPEIDEAIYRIIQEGMTNAFRHGRATKIKVGLWIAAGEPWPEVLVSLADNGEGAKQLEKGIGLSGMEERLKKLDGTLGASNISDGFEICARIPLKEQGEGR